MAKEIKENEILEEENNEDLVSYEIPDDDTDFPYERVILNGKDYNMKKGEVVMIPAGVKEILETRKRNQKKIKDALRERKNAAKHL